MTLIDRLTAPGPKRVLALDGGGIRGALTLGFLESVESMLRQRYNKPDLLLCDYFDLIGGTSTGAIIAAGLSIGMSASEIKKMYLDLGDKIFGEKKGAIGAILSGASFDFEPLENALKETFERIQIGGPEIKTGLCIVAKRADTLSTWPVINHPRGTYFDFNKDIYLWQMVRASSAAPSYFLPIEIHVGNKETGVFVDGGVSMANNPALQLFLVSTLKGFPFHWKTGKDELFILSMGTGTARVKRDLKAVKNMNMLEWAKFLPDLFMDDANYLNQTILQYLSDSPTPIRIDSEIGDLGEDLLGGREQLHYVRYNVWLEKDELARAGLNYTPEQVADMLEMSKAENRFELAKIGETFARLTVKPDHFPEAFDLGKPVVAAEAGIRHFSKGTSPDLPFMQAVKKPIPIRCIQMQEPFEVETLEGTLRGKAGDYLMVGVNGEMYPCSREIFEKTYTVVAG